MNRLAAAAALLVLAASPAVADWRDYQGKTLVVEVRQVRQTTTDVLQVRGSASGTDEVRNSDCQFIYHLYVSNRGRLFQHLARRDCADADPEDIEKPNGSIYDLTVPQGAAENDGTSHPPPYALRMDGDVLVIDNAREDFVFHGRGYVSTYTNSSGGSTMRLRLAPDCGFEGEGKAAYRREFASTDSDFYILEDTQWTFRTEAISCHIVDGFVARAE